MYIYNLKYVQLAIIPIHADSVGHPELILNYPPFRPRETRKNIIIPFIRLI